MPRTSTRKLTSSNTVIRLESGDHLPGDIGRVTAIAGVVGWLTAACLRGGHLDAAACLFEQLDGRKTDIRPEQVHEAGDEKPDRWRL
jgi:hypothetical protein